MKVTLELINSKIKGEEYLVSKSLKSTICILTLENGFEVRGESGVVDPANYNEELGNRIARENAVNKIWLLEGYLLQESLFSQAKNKKQENLKVLLYSAKFYDRGKLKSFCNGVMRIPNYEPEKDGFLSSIEEMIYSANEQYRGMDMNLESLTPLN